MSFQVREMAIRDYDEVIALWQESEGIGLSDADTREGVAHFLDRNPGLSLVACDGVQLAGAVLCGHDGRRGFIHHLAVHPSYRRRGLGRSLVDRCLGELKRLGIDKCHLFVYGENRDAIFFWQKTDWTERIDLIMMSKYT